MITDPTSAEEVLRQSEERFQLLVDAVQDYAIITLSPEGRVVTWNRGAERIKGYKSDEIIGKHFSCFYPPEAIARGTPELELRTAIEQGHSENEDWRVRKDGQLFWANVFLVGFGTSAPVAEDAYQRFIRLDVPSSACSDPHILANIGGNVGLDDLLFCISYSGAGRDIVEASPARTVSPAPHFDRNKLPFISGTGH